MRQPLILAVTALLSTGALAVEPVVAPTAASEPANSNVEEAKALIKEFAGTLKGELEVAVKSGGPTKAISVCKERAPAIAADLSARSGWEIGRVSLKPRNAQLDTPDAWEQQALTHFDEWKAAGQPVDTMAFAEVTTDDSGTRFRFIKAIPTGEVCLACHGSTIEPDVTAALDQAYPEDQARGYALGDVRGAFSLAKPIK